MTVRHPRLLLALACATMAVGGCGRSPGSRFYTLTPTASPGGAPPAAVTVAVGPVSIPAFVDRPQLVLQVESNQVFIDEFNRWAAPLGDAIARTVAGNLSVLLGTPRVVAGPLANFDPEYRVAIDVLRFESTPGQGVFVDAVWVVRAALGGATTSGLTAAHEPTVGNDFDALAAAHSRALTDLSTDIAAAIRAAAAR
jgi:uncharacterized lipoprotein YmbA